MANLSDSMDIWKNIAENMKVGSLKSFVCMDRILVWNSFIGIALITIWIGFYLGVFSNQLKSSLIPSVLPLSPRNGYNGSNILLLFFIMT